MYRHAQIIPRRFSQVTENNTEDRNIRLEYKKGIIETNSICCALGYTTKNEDLLVFSLRAAQHDTITQLHNDEYIPRRACRRDFEQACGQVRKCQIDNPTPEKSSTGSTTSTFIAWIPILDECAKTTALIATAAISKTCVVMSTPTKTL